MKPFVLTAFLLVLALPVSAQPAPQHPPYGPPLGLAEARVAAAAAEGEARGTGTLMVITVVEPTGEIVLLEKMDGTQYASVDIAIEKARSSARFRRTTKEFEDGVIGGRNALLGLTGAVPIAGGIPLLRNGMLVGAIGVSGGTNLQDEAVATAGAAAFH